MHQALEIVSSQVIDRLFPTRADFRAQPAQMPPGFRLFNAVSFCMVKIGYLHVRYSLINQI